MSYMIEWNDDSRPPQIVPGSLGSIRALGQYVLETAADHAMDTKLSYQLRLAVEEIATNAVIHGYRKKGTKGNLRIFTRSDCERLIIIVEDSSPAYDPRQTPAPQDLERPLTERPQGGLGVYLALKGVHAYDYQRIGDINRHTFVQLLPKDCDSK